MKIINILGSPRKKGTSARIARAFTDVAEAKGAEVTDYYLNGMTFKGCQACDQCHSKMERCILKDDLAPVLDDTHDADVIVMSSPVYYSDVSSQFKAYFDRTYSHLNMDNTTGAISTRLKKGKTAIFILSQGDVAERHTDIPERYQQYFDLHGFDAKVIRAVGNLSGRADEDVSGSQDEAARLAEAVMADFAK